MDYRESHRQEGKGESYQAAFSRNTYRSMIWQFEKNALDHILATFFLDAQIDLLDFACGTGRILNYLSSRTRQAVGVDLSQSMLEVARNNIGKGRIIEADLTREDILGDRKFNLITAFRFFPNAQPELRIQAMRVLSDHLADNGYIVFNNHKNTGSIRNRLARLCGRNEFRGMSLAEINDLLMESNLKVVKVYPLAIFPASEKRPLLPIFLLRPLDSILAWIRPFQNMGENLIFVCRRKMNIGI